MDIRLSFRGHNVPEFKRLLAACYEDQDDGGIFTFVQGKCWKTF